MATSLGVLALLGAVAATAQPPKTANAIHVIVPYKYHGIWMFDDPRVGLTKEPFVSGADRMIDRAVSGITHAEQAFCCYFPPRHFPGIRSNLSGNVR